MFLFDQLKTEDGPLRLIAVGIVAGLLVLVAGLWNVQVLSSKRYVESHNEQSFRTVRVPAVRGQILDRNGIALAESRATYNVSLYLDELRKSFRSEYQRQAAAMRERLRRRLTKEESDALELHVRFSVVSNVVAHLSSKLDQPFSIEATRFHRHYLTRRFLPFPVAQDLQPVHLARFEEQSVSTAGLDIETLPLRVYPYGSTAAHLLGYLVRDDSPSASEEAFFDSALQDYRGQIGLEGYFDEHLRGRGGVKSVQVNRLSYRQSESVWTPSAPGKNVVLTIDLPIQREAEKALRSVHPDVRGAAVVMDTRNGDILALASNPSFDPNWFIRGMTAEQNAKLQDAELKPQINRATQGIYPPGSILKVVTALAALEAGVLNPAEIYRVEPHPTRFGKGGIKVGNRVFGDEVPPGDYDFRRAFVKSSNAYFIHYGLRARVDRVVELAERMGLGHRAGIPNGQDKAGILPWNPSRDGRPRGWTDGDTANICIGQGPVAVTPVQMAVMTAAVANGGKVWCPRVVQRLEPQERELHPEQVLEFPPRLRADLGLNLRSLEIVREAMLADTEDREGTAFNAFHDRDRVTPLLKNFRVGGKTGTAQVTQGSRVVDHITWFVSFGPYENPRYAVVVMIESGSSGGGTCAPVARQIYTAIQMREAGHFSRQLIARSD